MEVARLLVDGTFASVVMRRTITAGLVGATVLVEYAPGIWDGLTKTVVFKGSETKDVVTNETTVEIPWEVLQEPSRRLHVGFFGVDADGKQIIPTIWADLGPIYPGADPSGDTSTDPRLPVWAQIADKVEQLSEEVDDLKEGGGPSAPGKPGADGEDGGYYTPAVTQLDEDTIQFAFTGSKEGMPAVAPVTVELPVGQGSGGNAENGEDGFSPIATVEQTDNGAVITITDKTGTTTATITNGKDGKDGADGQPGKDGADGAPGEKGEQGIQGVPGEKGEKGDTGTPGADGAKGDKGDPGKDGANGITPHVGSNGNWFIGENDTGIPATGPAGNQGLPGTPGEDGKDGTSATHSWNGTVLTVTSASGTSSADLKGEKGEKGDQGIQGIQGEPGADGAKGDKGDKGDTGATGAAGSNGKDGTSVTVKSVSESTADGGSNVVTFSDGKTVTIKNGSKGDKGDKGDTGETGQPGTDGINGADGKTPVRGVDYWNTADKAEIESYIATELAKRNQLAPEFAESLEWLEANGDQSKMYVLPDGMIYAWMMSEKEVESGASYPNLLPTATDTDGTTIYGGDYNGDGVNDGYKIETRLSGSSGSASTITNQYKDVTRTSGFIPAKVGDVVRIKNFSAPQGVQCYVISYNGTTRVNNKQFGLVSSDGTWKDDSNLTWYSVEGDQTREGVTTFTLDSTNFGTDFTSFRFSGTIEADTIVTINQEIKEGGGTEIVTEEGWASTGHAFVPADYEDRIVDVEKKASNNTARIVTLEKSVANGGAGDATEKDALNRIRNWDSPIYDRVPVFQLSAENPAVTSAERTVASIYAKYDALVAAYPNYITKTDLGVCSDGVTHVYRYDFREPEPHHQSGMQWSETKPVIICASGIHWEWGGVYSLYYALKAIAENAELDDLRRNVHFVVVPIINPYCFTDIGAYSETYGVLNANGVQIHRNFEVGFIYPGQSGYQELGTRNHGGTEPLSEIETQNIDNILKEFPDAALFLTCHSAQRDTRWGTGFIWASTATNYTCNLGYRLVDKLSKAWHKKYGTTWEEGCVRENNFVLSDTATYPNATALAEGDYRAGHAHVSATDGTETRQATKYGIQGANVEVLDTFWVLSSTELDSKMTTHGAETYINYLLMYMGCYDHKDKKEYAPNLPWSK